jgi:hypothetical protein
METNLIEEFTSISAKLLKSYENLNKIEEVTIASASKTAVYSEDKLTLYRYDRETEASYKTPVLIVYALVNTYKMLDLQPDRSYIKNLLAAGMDVYLIDWGFPTRSDRFLSMDDYINGYINTCVDVIRTKHQIEKANSLERRLLAFEMKVKGYTYKEIAAELEIHPRTAELDVEARIKDLEAVYKGNESMTAHWHMAMAKIEALTASIQIGRIYEGRVTSVKDFGAFVELVPGKDGLCHVSELSDEYVASVGDVCRVGDIMRVKVIAVDDQDRVKLSRKAAMREQAEAGNKGGNQ